jgi:CxxC motif-containing protein
MSVNFICIMCPRGCHLSVDGDKVSGNFCPVGARYGLQEAKDPKRTVTSTVLVKSEDGRIALCPVKTSSPIPKDKMIELMDYLRTLVFPLPIKMHMVLVRNVLNLGCDLIATKEIY